MNSLLDHEEHEGRQGTRRRGGDVEIVAREVVDAGLSVHRALGPGLLESVYEHCLDRELRLRGLTTGRQISLPIHYKGERLDASFRLDLVVAKSILVEVKSVEALSRLHEAQILTYLKLSGLGLGFLMNFNVPLFKQGLKRFVN